MRWEDRLIEHRDIDRLRGALLNDAAAQAVLMTHHDPAKFMAALIDWSAARGLPAPPTGAQPPHLQRGWPGEEWLPARIDVAADQADWLCFAGIAIGQPFFDDAVAHARARPLNRFLRVTTRLTDLVAAAPPPVAPKGIILHMSRCGSTLAAQMIDALPGVRTVAEPQPIDAIVRADMDQVAKVAALRAVAHALGRGAAATVLKLDSWHAPALPLLRAAFPDTPWVFLYRDPVEVIVSHLAQRGMHTVPGLIEPELLDIPAGDSGADPAASIAGAVGGICRAVARHWQLGGGMLIDYSALPDAVATQILPHFGIAPGPDGLAALAADGRRDAKQPDRRFAADSDAKQARADGAVRAAAKRYLTGPIAALDAIRTASAPRRSS